MISSRWIKKPAHVILDHNILQFCLFLGLFLLFSFCWWNLNKSQDAINRYIAKRLIMIFLSPIKNDGIPGRSIQLLFNLIIVNAILFTKVKTIHSDWCNSLLFSVLNQVKFRHHSSYSSFSCILNEKKNEFSSCQNLRASKIDKKYLISFFMDPFMMTESWVCPRASAVHT